MDPLAVPHGPALAAQDSLRRIERLTQQPDGRHVFDGVVEALGRILDADAAWLVHFDTDAFITIEGAWSTAELPLPVGTRQVISDEMRQLRAGGRPYRVDLAGAPPGSAFGDEARRLGIASAVGVPVWVAGEVWALAVVARFRPEAFPADTERRMTSVVEPLAAVLATAVTRAELSEWRREQEALRRLTKRLTPGLRPDELLGVAVTEASTLLGGRPVLLARLEEDRRHGVVVAVSVTDVPVGSRFAAQDDPLVSRLVLTRRPERIDDHPSDPAGWMADGLRPRAVVGAPVEVDGQLWGVLAAYSFDEPLPAGTEGRLGDVAEAVATALTTARTRAELQRVADEQAALRRVAELVAREVSLPDVLAEVAVEASRLLGVGTALLRFDPDGHAEIVSVDRSSAQLGLRIPTTDEFIGRMFTSGRAARLADYEELGFAAAVQDLGLAPGVAVPITVEGRTWGALKTSPSGAALPPDADRAEVESVAEKLEKFAALASAAIANVENRTQLTASRARIVASADEARSRLQRDVHDGAQQRLVQTVLTLKLARAAAAAGEPTEDLVEEALGHAERATAELRDIVHGIMPASLVRGGLRNGIESVVADLPLPVELDFEAPRLPAGAELTAYFIVAEALTNVVKHAGASRVSVRVATAAGRLLIEVSDDGSGGADPTRGSGLTGLADRVATAEGDLVITSPPAAGTVLRASFPVVGL